MKYYDQYRNLVEMGKIPLCKEMHLALDRIERFNQEYISRQDEVDKRIDFIEHECRNTKGRRDLLKLTLPQKVWLETAWGFYYPKDVTKVNPSTMEEYKETEERRLIHQIPIIVSRGTGKTTLGSAIGTVMQIIDGEYGADVQMLGYVRKQANQLFEASRTMSSYEDSILYALRQSGQLRSTKQGILYEPTNSLMQIMTADYDSLDGTNCHCTIFDEVHTYSEDFIKIVNDGSSRKRKNWQTFYLSTNGTKRNAVFDKYYDFWIKILNGKIDDDTIMPFIYKLDDVAEVDNPKMWVKAIPHLNITTEAEEVERDIRNARESHDTVAQAEILAKTFNIPMNSFQAYFTNEECEGHSKDFDADLFVGNEDRNAYCIIGLDLSDVNDICSASFMIPKADRRFFVARKYIPRKRFEELPHDVAEKYSEWADKGLLVIHELDYNDQEMIFNDLRTYMQKHRMYPVGVGYDKWNAREIVRLFTDYYGDICVNIPQTVKGLSQYLKIYKEKIKNGNIIFKDSLMGWCHSNVRVKVDANNNVFPNKQKAKEKIDVFASNLDAFITYEKNREEYIYYFSNLMEE